MLAFRHYCSPYPEKNIRGFVLNTQVNAMLALRHYCSYYPERDIGGFVLNTQASDILCRNYR